MNKNGIEIVGITLGLLGLIILAGLLTSVSIVPAGYKGVVTTFGEATGTFNEGLNFKLPIVQSVVKFDTRNTKHEVDASAASKDLQIVTTNVAINYRVNPSGVQWLYENVGTNYEFKIIDPAIQESIKSVTAKFTAEELITDRAVVREQIRIALQDKVDELSDKSIRIHELNIINFAFSEQFANAIEQKQVAEQDALKAQRELERIKIEAQQKIEQAKAEAESIRIQSEAIQESSEILQLRWIEKWNGVLPTVVSEGSTLLQIPLD